MVGLLSNVWSYSCIHCQTFPPLGGGGIKQHFVLTTFCLVCLLSNFSITRWMGGTLSYIISCSPVHVWGGVGSLLNKFLI